MKNRLLMAVLAFVTAAGVSSPAAAEPHVNRAHGKGIDVWGNEFRFNVKGTGDGEAAKGRYEYRNRDGRRFVGEITCLRATSEGAHFGGVSANDSGGQPTGQTFAVLVGDDVYWGDAIARDRFLTVGTFPWVSPCHVLVEVDAPLPPPIRAGNIEVRSAA